MTSFCSLTGYVFYSTGTPVCVLVLKKCKRHDDVLFINAAGPENFQKGKRQNVLLEDYLAKVLDTYRERKELGVAPHWIAVSMRPFTQPAH